MTRRSDGLVFSTREHVLLDRNYINAKRHYYASVLLDAGESVRALAEYLGGRGLHVARLHAPDAG